MGNIYTLTDFGAKAAMQLADTEYVLPQGFSQHEEGILSRLYSDSLIAAQEYDGDLSAIGSLMRNGVVMEEFIVDGSESEVKRRLKERFHTNPVKQAYVMMLEYTTLCNLKCSGCFKGYTPRVTEEKVEDLSRAAEEAKQMGISTFLFNGGEVTKYAKRWLGLARSISSTGHTAAVVTNGWWGIEGDIITADGIYHGADHYAQALSDAGIGFMMFSLDGLEEEHDIFRRSPGLYRKVLRAVDAVKKAGIQPAVSIVLHEGIKDKQRFFDEVRRIFEVDESLEDLLRHRENVLNTRVLLEELGDIGYAVDFMGDRSDAPYSIENVEELNGFCKGITQGFKISIRADGSFQPCTQGVMDKGFGNIHVDSLPAIINRMRESVVYKMFNENRFKEYAQYVDRSIFGERFFERCTILAILSSLAPGIDALKRQDALTEENILELNKKVARVTGHLH